MNPTSVSEDLISKIKAREGFTPVCKCLPGDRPDVYTYGFGQTGCRHGSSISEQDADGLLRSKVQAIVIRVLKLVKVSINQNQLDSICDLSYNIGIDAFSKSTLLKLLNSGLYNEADLEFSKWNKANGKVLSGLTKRRTEEAKEFLS